MPEVTNTGPSNCIFINGATVTGNVTNTSRGAITATGIFVPTGAGIKILNSSIGGAVVSRRST